MKHFLTLIMIIIASITSYSQIRSESLVVNVSDSMVVAHLRNLPKMAQAVILTKDLVDHGYELKVPDYGLYPTHFQSFESALNEFKERLEDEIWKFEK